jgi:hypothetical protein
MFEEFEGLSKHAAFLIAFLFATPHLMIKIYKIDQDKAHEVFSLFIFFFLAFACYRFFVAIFSSETPIVMAIGAVALFMMTGSYVKKSMLSNTE